MTKSLACIWAELDASGKSDEAGWNSLRIHPETTCSIRVAIRYPDRVPALLIEADAKSMDNIAEYPNAKGFEVYAEAIEPGPLGRTRICLVLTDTSRKDVFGILSEDVIEAVLESSSEPMAIRAFLARLHAWQIFMRRQVESLTIEEQIGLFAEITFLLNCLAGRIPIQEAIDAWRGPGGGLRDFSFGKCDVEIKATTLKSKPKFFVYNFAQLDETSVEILILFIYRLSDSDQGKTLPELVEDARIAFDRNGTNSKNAFENRLLEAGFLDLHSHNYIGRRYSVISSKCYHVRGEFPRIKNSDLRDGVLEGSYSVDTSKCSPFEIGLDFTYKCIQSGRIRNE